LSKRGSGVSKVDVEKALVKLNLDIKLTDLDENQLDFLVNYMQAVRDDKANSVLLSQ